MSGGPGAAQRQNSDFGRYSGGYDQPQEDPYAQGGQYGAGQQRKYNPADYANVNPGYGGPQPAAQAQRPVQQQPAQQPPPHCLVNRSKRDKMMDADDFTCPSIDYDA
ncbi:unnamed protein product [Fusarium graminearum]|nr:unnamed protein product [Fusarium graminearum]